MSKAQFEQLQLLKDFYLNELFPFVDSRPDLLALEPNIAQCIDFRRTMVIPVIDSLQELDPEEDTDLWCKTNAFVRFVLHRFLDLNAYQEHWQRRATNGFRESFERGVIQTLFSTIEQNEKRILQSYRGSIGVWFIYNYTSNKYLNMINVLLSECMKTLLESSSRHPNLTDYANVKFTLEVHYDRFVKDLPKLIKTENEVSLEKIERTFSTALAAANQLETLQLPEYQRIDLLTFYKTNNGFIETKHHN
jgi:hypothetical protein